MAGLVISELVPGSIAQLGHVCVNTRKILVCDGQHCKFVYLGGVGIEVVVQKLGLGVSAVSTHESRFRLRFS